MLDSMQKEYVKTIDNCWKALKIQLECHNINKEEVAKLSEFIVDAIKNLTIICGENHD